MQRVTQVPVRHCRAGMRARGAAHRQPVALGRLRRRWGLLVSALVVMALPIVAYAWRIVPEERMLAARSGKQWRSYSRHTWRLVQLIF